jgi:hypothetical protein
VKVTLIPVPTSAEDEVSTVELAAGAPTTVKEKEAIAVAGVLSESATCTAKVETPAAVGVPDITPVGESDSPGGKAPEATLQV